MQEVANALNKPYEDAALWPSDIAASVKINPSAFNAWLDALPEHWENIEDRREHKSKDDEEEDFRRKRGHSERNSIGEWPKAKE
jgi:hypothetical protein